MSRIRFQNNILSNTCCSLSSSCRKCKLYTGKTVECFAYGINCVAKQCPDEWLLRIVLSVKLQQSFLSFVFYLESYSHFVVAALVSLFRVTLFYFICVRFVFTKTSRSQIFCIWLPALNPHRNRRRTNMDCSIMKIFGRVVSSYVVNSSFKYYWISRGLRKHLFWERVPLVYSSKKIVYMTRFYSLLY